MKSTRHPIAALFAASVLAFAMIGTAAPAHAQSRTSKKVTVTKTSKKTSKKKTSTKKTSRKKGATTTRTTTTTRTPARQNTTRTTTRTTTTRTTRTPARRTTTTVERKSTPTRVVKRKVVKRAPSYERVVVRGQSYYRRDGRFYQRVSRRGHVEYVALSRPPAGHRVAKLPRGAKVVRRNGRNAWRHDGVHYTRVRIGSGGFAFEVTSW